jgi:3-hydroxyacyl-CoA dehydrogenase/enoyl-CoA hydratase/3-hydroxybutyryl-CoA epimerase
MGHSWSLTVDADRIAWLICDIPGTSTNVLSAEVLSDLAGQLDIIEREPPAGVVIGSGKDNGFFAGADIKEFRRITTPAEAFELVRAGQAILQRIEDLPCASVAALHGYALGGGLELALACRYRVAADDATLALGFPEVLLGIHPGFGGTVRSVQVAGVRPALDLMLKGKPYRGARALHVGLIDELVPRESLRQRAKARALAAPTTTTAPFVDKLLNLGFARPFFARQATSALRRTLRREQYPAPYAIVDLWRQHGAARSSGYTAEARSIADLMCTDTSRNLVRVFTLQERLKNLASDSRATFHRVHIIGAGVMGGDIAAWSALRGMSVTLQDRSSELLAPAMDRARRFLEKRLKDPAAAAAALARLHGDVAGDGIADADVVLEAIVENAGAKRELYARVEPRLKAGALLATNTSSIEIETLCRGLQDPGRLVGLHFFNPVSQLPLVEVVQGQSTRAQVIDDAIRFTRVLDKLPLPCRSAPGFLVNRILTPYVNEALRLFEGGIPADMIDRTAKDFGMPMGPIELTDVVGLDVSLHVGRMLAAAFDRKVPPILEQLAAQNKLGRKSGQGFYEWRDGKPQRSHSRTAVPEDLQDRLILPMLNEAVACLRQGVVEDADLLDAGAIFATGFAPFRGGPVHHAKARGIGSVVARLEQLAERHGERFRPDVGWQQLAT